MPPAEPSQSSSVHRGAPGVLLSELALTLADIEAAARRINGVVHRTPLLTSRLLDERIGARVFAKAEHLQRAGSFKIRGAYNRLAQLTDAERAAGVVAFSSGNHAQGVALAARLLGVKATIVMPRDAPAVKKQATRDYGAAVVEYDRYSDDREAIARDVAGEHGALVPPFNDLRVIAGQGTVGIEVMEELPDIDIALVPVGGGGLASGMAIAMKSMKPSIRIYGVEPEAADDARQSLEARRIVTVPQPVTVADGVATPAIGTHTFPILSALLDGIVTVTEDEILSALGYVVTRMKQAVEPTGALTTAALLQGRIPGVAGRNVLTVFCGGNLDPSVLVRLPV
jgi:threo-3-hydroxy-L-aspartate ammonia-lyase